jgi:hypothetical protein
MALSYKTAFSFQLNASAITLTSTTYVQVINASSIGNYQVGKLQYFNSTAQVLVMAVSPGTSSTAYNLLSIPPTNNPVVIEMLVPANNNIFLKSLTANATSGEVTLDFFI